MQDGAAEQTQAKRGRGRPRKVPAFLPPAPVAEARRPEPSPPVPVKRGRGRPRKDSTAAVADVERRMSTAMADAESCGLLPMMRREPEARFEVRAGMSPDLSGYDLAMLADALSSMISTGSSEALGRQRAFDVLRTVYDRAPVDDVVRHVDAAHALLIHDGHRIALGDMADKRHAAATLAHRLDQIYARAMDPDVFSKAAGVALKAATLRAKLHGIDVEALRIDLRADVQVEHSDPVRDGIVQRLLAMKRAQAERPALDVEADE